jgi:integrase
MGDRADSWLLLSPAARIAAAKSRRRCVAVVPDTPAQRSGKEQPRCVIRRLRRGHSELLLDAAGRRRSPATLPDFHAGRAPRNKGIRYPADPQTVEEIIAVMRRAGNGVHGRRLRGLIVVLWRAGLRIHEALALAEADLDARRGSVLVRRGKGGRRREVGMDDWAWEQLAPWLQARVELPIGPLFCVITGPTRGRPGRPPRRARICGTWRAGPVCGDALRRISCAMPMPLRWRTRACR